MNPRGATLLELTVTVTVLAIIASALAPVVNAAVDSYGSARDARDAAESVSFGIDRCVRVLRETPEGASTGTVGIAAASSQRVALTDGRVIELIAGELLLTEGGISAPIAVGVDSFELRYLGEDGVTDTAASPGDTHSVQVSLSNGRLELRSVAFLRVRGTS